MDNRELIFEISELNSIGEIDLEKLNYNRNKDFEEIEFEGEKYKITCIDEICETSIYYSSRNRTLMFKIECDDELICYFAKKTFELYDIHEECYEIIETEFMEMKQTEITTLIWEKVGKNI